MGEAYATFTEADSETPVFLSACYGFFDLILNEGLTGLELGNHAQKQGDVGLAQKYWKNAAEKFGKIEQLSSSVVVPARIAAEIELGRALAYAKERNMEAFITAFEKGVSMVKELAARNGSRRRGVLCMQHLSGGRMSNG